MKIEGLHVKVKSLTPTPFILVTGKRNNIVMISQEDWSAIEETLYLNSIPNMALSIQSAMNDSNDAFSETIEW